MGLPEILMNASIDVYTATEVTDYGTKIFDWNQPILLATIAHCSVQPITTSEITDGREALITRLQVWAPPRPRVKGTHRVKYDSEWWQVDGDVMRWDDPFGQLSHQTFYLRKVEG